MRLTLRAKLIAIVGAAALAFLVLILASAFIANRVDEKLTTIQERYVPKVELEPRLLGQFEQLRRALQDAVGARDPEALEATRELKNVFLQDLAAAKVVNPVDASALRSAIDDYYAVAYDVSRRIIAGETGEALVDAIALMQAKQGVAAEALKKVTGFDRGELTEAFSAATKAQATATRVRLLVSVACMFFVIVLSLGMTRGVLRSLTELAAGLTRFGKGAFEEPIRITSTDEIGRVAEQANQMAEGLSRLGAERDSVDWLKSGHGGLTQELRGELSPAEVATRAVRFLARRLDAPSAALYYADQDRVLRLLGHYALSVTGSEKDAIPSFKLGQGLVGQAALQDEIMVFQDPPTDYLRVRSGLGESSPRAIVMVPLVHLGKVAGVIELALFTPWSDRAAELLLSVRETLAIAIDVARSRAAMRELLANTQEQAERLTTQEEELRSTNEELQAQQEELRQANEELTQQTNQLIEQRRTLEHNNAELGDARLRLEQKAEELTKVSAYKSQFLANMSHELRTPLNSMLLLSNLLADNDTGNLTDKQVEFSRTIHSAGSDLLALINQVLDLAKVEAGKQEVRIAPVALSVLAEHAKRVFEPLAHDKGLKLVVDIAPGLPKTIATDRRRVEQILNNLLANAIKFTERGEVSLRIGAPGPGASFRRDDLLADRVVALAVTDTGVGIAPEHQERIFAPFEQVEAAPDRRYGGTGLGLAIAKELAALLGGELQLRSASGEGSTFVCYLPHAQLPVVLPLASMSSPAIHRSAASMGPRKMDGIVEVTTSDRPYFLVIEDDPVFAAAFGEIIHDQGFGYAVAADGRTGLTLAKDRKPSGIILDVRLPDIDGWEIMRELQAHPATAGIPVHFVSAVDGAERAMAMGAVGYLTKPASRRDLVRVLQSLAPNRDLRSSRILVVEDDAATGDSLVMQLAMENLEARRVPNAERAREALKHERFGCMIIDLSLPQLNGLEFLQSLHEDCGAEMPSVVVYAARALSKDEAKQLDAHTEAIVLKEGASNERLLNEIRLFVRRLREGGPRRQEGPRLNPANVNLAGRRVLVVDDDMRTVYALSATLRAKGVEVLVADTGHAALAMLAKHPGVEAVLMDIMMPEMDGYEAMRRIRKDARFLSLPVIALTAKAMKDDHEKCIEAGASDYLPKPIDPDRLLAMLHARLSRDPADGS